MSDDTLKKQDIVASQASLESGAPYYIRSNLRRYMRKFVSRILCLVCMLSLGFLWLGGVAMAEDGEEAAEDESTAKPATSISISPVSKILQLDANSVYEDSFKITNNGSSQLKFEVHASPYSYVFSEETNDYQLGFSQENNYTQIVRWITFKDKNGDYVANPYFVVGPDETVVVEYRISTPASIPAGGQYAVLFAHTISEDTTSGGVKTEASPGMVVYGRANGETIVTGEISSLTINQSISDGETTKGIINAASKVKNTGNVDFMASGTLKVEGIFGRSYYETPANRGKASIIPEAELAVSDQWDDTPYFGLFKATWTVGAAGESESISQIILILPAPILVTMILLLTIVIIWITIMLRRRKERRSRFMV